MRERTKHIASGRPFDQLLPFLNGRVFHVTKDQNWPQILASGTLLPMPPEGQYVTSFGSRSYFRERGCISLFDYRNFGEKKCQEHYWKCLPTTPLAEESPIRILFLNPNHYELLIPWADWKIDGVGKNVVPYVEVGIAGKVPLEYFGEVMLVTVTEDKNSLAYRLKLAQRRRYDG